MFWLCRNGHLVPQHQSLCPTCGVPPAPLPVAHVAGRPSSREAVAARPIPVEAPYFAPPPVPSFIYPASVPNQSFPSPAPAPAPQPVSCMPQPFPLDLPLPPADVRGHRPGCRGGACNCMAANSEAPQFNKFVCAKCQQLKISRQKSNIPGISGAICSACYCKQRRTAIRKCAQCFGVLSGDFYKSNIPGTTGQICDTCYRHCNNPQPRMCLKCFKTGTNMQFRRANPTELRSGWICFACYNIKYPKD